jgi:muskelin
MMLPAVQALRFLQAEVAEVADPASEEGDVLRELLAPLIGRSGPSSGVISPPSPGTVPVNTETYKARREVFQRVMEFFPKEAKEPSADLVEMINWYEEGGVD